MFVELRPPRRRVRRGGARAGRGRPALTAGDAVTTRRRVTERGAGREPARADRPAPVAARRSGAAPGRALGSVLRGLLARPLASYYLLLASAGLLLVIGLVMVFSATSVEAYAASGNAFASIEQAGACYAAVGLVAFWFCQRLPVRTYRALARPRPDRRVRPASCVLDVLALLAQVGRAGTTRRSVRCAPTSCGSTSARCRCSRPSWPSSALALWGADVLVRKGEQAGALAGPGAAAVPGGRRCCFVLVGYNDLGTMICLLILFVGLLWAAGVRLRVFAGMVVVALVGIAGADRAARQRLPAGPARPASCTRELRASIGDRATRSGRACSRSPTAAGSASASARATSSGAGCPTGTTTSSSR